MTVLIDNRNLKIGPKFSIITAVLNGGKSLEVCIQSVLSQTSDEYEYIIIDGGSTDDSLKIAERYSSEITYLESKKDEGIYFAFNRGITLSQGKIIGILNSDDSYLSHTLAKVEAVYNSLPHGDHIIYGGIKLKNSVSTTQFISHEELNKRMIFHPSTFVTRTVYEKVGAFDTSFKVAGDYEFMHRCLHRGINFVPIREPLSLYFLGGFSEQKWKTSILETLRIQAKSNNWSFFRMSIIYLERMTKNQLIRWLSKFKLGRVK